MTRKVLTCLSLLVLCAGRAWSAGINLAWDDCPAGAGASFVKTFACDTNAGSHTLFGSFVAPAEVLQVSANEVTIDFATAGALLPDWWMLGTGRCRPTALSLDVDFTAGSHACYDYWQGGAIGGTAELLLGGNRARIKAVYALPAGDPRITSIPEGTHVYAFKIILNHQNSAGLGACTGCGAEACISLVFIKLNQPVAVGPAIFITNPDVSQYVTWQGWSNLNPAYGCPTITPTRTQTWGSIKALYR
jgi:hypothetical protein